MNDFPLITYYEFVFKQLIYNMEELIMNFAAHELLETSEALRTKAAEIEQYGLLAKQCKDQRLKGILQKHQQQMMNAYQQGINLLQGKGGQVTHMPQFSITMKQI
jgi:hypothetical protein